MSVRRLVILSISILVLAVSLFIWRRFPDFHQRHGCTDLPPEMAVEQFSRIAGMRTVPGLMVVRAFGNAEYHWFELRVPPEQLPEIEAGIRRVAEARGAAPLCFRHGLVQESEILGMPNPSWFRASRLAEPTQAFQVHLFGGPPCSIYYSESEGTILLRVP